MTGINNLTSHAFNLGVTTVAYPVIDALGCSTSCSFSARVTDKVAPVALCQNITDNLDINTGEATITAAYINNVSFDNCGIASMTIDKSNLDCMNLGSLAVDV